jgi:hypothetical protein
MKVYLETLGKSGSSQGDKQPGLEYDSEYQNFMQE